MHTAPDVSLFRGIGTTPTETLPLADVIARIRDGTYRQAVERVRRLHGIDDARYQEAKRHLPSFTPACALTTRGRDVPWDEKLRSVTGLVHLDLDNVADVEALRRRLRPVRHVVFVFTSPSGTGLKVGLAASGITDAASYKHAWQVVSAQVQQAYPEASVSLDTNVSALNSLCFVSYDPDALWHPLGKPPEPLPVPPPRRPPPARPPAEQPGTSTDRETVAAMLDALPDMAIDDYKTWLDVGMALHSTQEPWAYDLWDQWSQRGDNYAADSLRYKWDGFDANGPITLGTLVHLARQHGWRGSVMRQEASGDAPGEKDDSDTRPVIRWAKHNITAVVDQAESAMLQHPGLGLYQRGGSLVVIAHDGAPPKWLKRPAGLPTIRACQPAHLTELADQAARWEKYNERSKDFVPTVPPALLAPTLLGRPQWRFPRLEGVLGAPTLRPDGSVITAPGYDADTGLYLACNGTVFPAIHPVTTRDDVDAAIAMLYEVVRDFPFVEQHHRTAWLAAVLTLTCRFIVDGPVPLFGITATTRGSGKSLLADTIALIATGREASKWSQVHDEDEERKRLMAIALEGDPVVCIDNVTRAFGSGPMAVAITGGTIQDRLLGASESRRMPINAVFLATGNNMQYVETMARRVVPIAIDPKVERPEERTGFARPHLLRWVRDERPSLLVAALTIVKGFLDAGCPPQDFTPMGSFEAWDRIIRQAILWAKEPDPCAGRAAVEQQHDPEYEDLATLLDAWHACYNHEAMRRDWDDITPTPTLKEVVAHITKYAQHVGPESHANSWNDLRDALAAYDQHGGKDLNTRSIGKALRKVQGRVIGDKRFETARYTAQRALRWRVACNGQCCTETALRSM